MPMTLLVESYWREISDGLSEHGIPIQHFVLPPTKPRSATVYRTSKTLAPRRSASRTWSRTPRQFIPGCTMKPRSSTPHTSHAVTCRRFIMDGQAGFERRSCSSPLGGKVKALTLLMPAGTAASIMNSFGTQRRSVSFIRRRSQQENGMEGGQLQGCRTEQLPGEARGPGP